MSTIVTVDYKCDLCGVLQSADSERSTDSVHYPPKGWIEIVGRPFKHLCVDCCAAFLNSIGNNKT